ncbi:hypothetical protein RN001_013078 [Aquatica leii]|uniref:Pericentrin/AKAP-450 centrosomal targeting domain-containing protein n=1 Tax=Aquatica leii TaxID=1421715 RepID=A0AAN7SLF1_9COLE|nr:hypothetical protein RN001_013078 [Aquatica leii]
MEDERQKKVEVGREKLAAFKKKKQRHSSKSTSTSQSDSSISLSPPLPDVKKQSTDDVFSDSSIVSEHLNSNSGSIENDRSFQEIEISNIPSNFSLLLHNLSSDDTSEHISRELKPSPLSILSSNSGSFNVLEKVDLDSKNNVQSILSEILRSEQFKSDSDHTLHQSDVDSNDNSFNLFKDINLNDSIINDYRLKSVQEERNDDLSLNVTNLSLGLSGRGDESLKVKQLEEIVNTKESTIAALSAELESLKEMTCSNQSTPSLNTSTTDYKVYHDEFQNKIVEYQSALSHRDTIIQQLTEALEQSVLNRKQLQDQSDFFSKEIANLQKQLSETSALLVQRKWDATDAELKHDSLKSIKDSSIQTDSLPSQILLHEKDLFIDETDYKPNPVMAESQTSLLGSFSFDKSTVRLDKEWLPLEQTLTQPQLEVMKEIKDSINSGVETKLAEYRIKFQNEFAALKEKLESERSGYETEVNQLRELLNDPNDVVALRKELERKHAGEMEELRTYFEQKCADLEKHYSEEVFSQQSRKMSESSLCSESSDILISGAHAGPGGDTGFNIETRKKHFQEFSKQDCVKLQKDLSNVVKNLNKYDLEKINNDEHRNLLNELQEHNLQSVFKFDLTGFKLEMQNKFHAELEILREDYENRIDVLNVDHNAQLLNLEKKYVEQIDSLKLELDEALRNVEMNVSTAVQEVASSGEFELAEVVHSYERRLQEQVTLAKIDIINALEHQIQMLVANTVEDAEWPTELLQIRHRFTERYEKQIAQLEKDHQDEIARLKDEHFKKLNGAVERARKKNLSENESEVIQERDNLRKTTILLRHLIGQLMKYFSECEDEVNKTIVDELLKQSLGKNLTELELELNLDDESNSSNCNSLTGKKRVHFKPNFEEIISTIDDTDANLSLELRNELESCLERLKSEANAILNLSISYNKPEIKKETDSEVRIASLTRQLVSEGKLKRDLAIELEEARMFVQSLETERSNLEHQVEQLINKQKVLEDDLNKARGKITEFVESGHKELMSKGYGDSSNTETRSLGERIVILGELQDRARSMVVECAGSANHPLFELVEELCREGSRVSEEVKHEHEDFQKQIEAADKKLRATCRFLEEQAAEREQERDEAQKEIASLREQIRERDKDRVSCEQINKEVEHLESQMREMSKLIDDNEIKRNEIELERKEAIEKVFVLRDIIRDLEAQVEKKTENEAELNTVILQLQDIVKQQKKANDELSSGKNAGEGRSYQKHVEQLEDEIQRLKLNAEFAGSEGVLKQLKAQLSEFEHIIDERTRELEGLHFTVSTTNCSSPSEDMSVRDQIRPRTPSECDLPLQQLASLKEKLIKHSRSEDAAIKRIHDLEMEIDGIKQDLNEVQNERDLLQDQVSEHLILISSLQMRLDDQRLRADQVQKQTNTSLEVRIYDLESEIKNLLDVIAARDKSIKHLNKTIEETKRKLGDQEIELTAKLEDTLVLELNEKIKKLENENASLLYKINNDAQNAHVLPSLVDNILADKNKDIEKLQEKLDKTQKQLNEYLSLNLDREQLQTLSQLTNSERAFSEMLSMLDHDAPDTLRKVEREHESLTSSIDTQPHKRNPNETVFLGSADISSIEKLGKSNIHYSVEAPLTKPNSTEIQKSNDKRVHFEDSVFNATIEKLHEELLELKNELLAKDELITEYSERLQVFGNLETNIHKLQAKLELTEKALQDATSDFEKELSNAKESEKNLQVNLAEKKMHLTKREEELYLLQQDWNRKDQMYVGLVKEKRELEKKLHNLEEELQKYKECESVINDNNKEIVNLKAQLTDVANSVESIKSLEAELNEKRAEVKELQENYNTKTIDLQTKLDIFEKEIVEKDRTNAKLQKDLSNKESQLISLSAELDELRKTIESKNEEIRGAKKEKEKIVAEFETNIKELKELLIDRETEIEILNEDTQRYQDDITQLENHLKQLKSSTKREYEVKLAQTQRDVASKDLEIVKLSTDVDDLNRKAACLQGLLEEKDKIVKQMSEDGKILRVNLETIQNKMQESGNVVDLKRRLDEEKQLNESLKEQLNVLKLERGDNKPIDMTASIEDITGEVRKQLEYSAHLDSSILSALEVGEKEDLGMLKERALNTDLKKLNHILQEKVNDLEKKCRFAEENVAHLQLLLENEKRVCTNIQLEDANILEELRLRLEAALENEVQFQNLLEFEKQNNFKLEEQVQTLKQKLIGLSSGENSKTEVTEYKSLPTLESLELNKLRTEVHGLESEVKKLLSDIKDLKTDKLNSNATLKYTKDMLQLKNAEMDKLHKRIEALVEAEATLKEKWVTSKAELDQKSRELENSRILIGELEQEQRQMKRQLNKLNDNFAKALSRERKLVDDVQSGQQTVPEKVLQKINELHGTIQKHIKENEQLVKITENLNKERLKLQNRIAELEELNHIKFPFDDPIVRANHLFAKYLRSESYRKALIWQKKYIVSLLASYQYSPRQNSPKPTQKLHGICRFRAVATCTIAVVRMQFLVQRWRSGVREVVGIRHNRQSKYTHLPLSAPNYTPFSGSTQFQVGEPVSSQNFPIPLIPLDPNLNRSPIPSTSRQSDLLSWSGQTPPSRDYSARRRDVTTKY